LVKVISGSSAIIAELRTFSIVDDVTSTAANHVLGNIIHQSVIADIQQAQNNQHATSGMDSLEKMKQSATAKSDKLGRMVCKKCTLRSFHSNNDCSSSVEHD
jgi:hypothetical protein